MPSRQTRILAGRVLAGTICFICTLPSPARAQRGPDYRLAASLEQAERLRTADHPHFVELLHTLHRRVATMSPGERWHLRYLDGWEASFRGEFATADPLLREVIGHSGDAVLSAKASAVLIGDLNSQKQYGEAFELANRSIAALPRTRDRLARFMILSYVSQLLRSAGQYELAAKYLREMARTLPPGETSCQPRVTLMTVLYADHKLSPSSSNLQGAIEACRAAGQPVMVHTAQLVEASLYLDTGQPAKAVELLRRIAPDIRASQYYSNMLASKVELAQAYWRLGNDTSARQAALAALALSDPGDISESLRDAYEVLYQIENKRHHPDAALDYYRQYVAQDKGNLNDIRARALAYAMAQQGLLAQKLQTERLSKQNSVLRLQRALDAKKVETGRLYISLLLFTLVSIAFWLFRTKRSQLRFKQMSVRDGLTGIFNHQHFIGQAELALRALERKRVNACLVFIDLDHFKQVNDTHGHAMGDAVLKHTVETCQRQLRPGDLFGRLGGEEFGILLTGCAREQGVAIADRIRGAIGAHLIERDGCRVSVSASVGLASTDTSGYALQPLCMEADAALYRAKRTGRNRVVAHVAGDGLVNA